MKTETLLISCFLIVIIISIIGVLCIKPIQKRCRALRMTTEVNTETEFNELIRDENNNNVVLIYSPTCPACVHAKKTYKGLLKQDDVDRLYLVRYDIVHSFMKKNKIRGIPVYIHSKNKSFLVGTGTVESVMDNLRNSTQRFS